MNGYLQIVLCEEGAPDQVILGGAGWETMTETRREFARIPSVGESVVVVDLLRGDDIVADKYVSRSTAETLLGKSIAATRDEGIERAGVEQAAWAAQR